MPYGFEVSFSFRAFTDGRTPWTGDQLVARPLPKHRKTQTQNIHIHIPNIHALCGIRNHDPSFRATKDSTCLRPLGYRDQQNNAFTSLLYLNPVLSLRVTFQRKFTNSAELITIETISPNHTEER
jgi:hypothetical protein